MKKDRYLSGNGNEVRDYVHVKDAAKLSVKL